jgi:hypothetical protein
VDKPTVAMPVLLLIHVPPDEASDNITVVPTHIVVFPEIGGAALIVTVARDLQPPEAGM